MTTVPLVFEASILGAASVLGVSKLYDMERHARTWPDSVIAFLLLIGWMGAAAFSLASSLLALKGVDVSGAKWVLLIVIGMTFATHTLKQMGLLKTTIFDDDQERDAQPVVRVVSSAGPKYADYRPDARLDVAQRSAKA